MYGWHQKTALTFCLPMTYVDVFRYPISRILRVFVVKISHDEFFHKVGP